MRAIVRHRATRSAPEDLLNIVDRRTLLKLMAASGSRGDRLPSKVEEFLGRQRLIASPQAVAQVKLALERLGAIPTPAGAD